MTATTDILGAAPQQTVPTSNARNWGMAVGAGTAVFAGVAAAAFASAAFVTTAPVVLLAAATAGAVLVVGMMTISIFMQEFGLEIMLGALPKADRDAAVRSKLEELRNSGTRKFMEGFVGGAAAVAAIAAVAGAGAFYQSGFHLPSLRAG